MTLQYLIQTFGYPVILVGTFLEGETILLLAGFAAHRGYLDLKLVMLCAFIGTLAGDQLFFFIGRWQGESFIEKHPRWKPRLMRARILIHRYRILIILAFRFIYGMRTVTPFALGSSRVSVPLFVVLNTVGALIWTLAVTMLGYLFGHAAEVIMGEIKQSEAIILAGLALFGALVWLWHRWRDRKASKGR